MDTEVVTEGASAGLALRTDQYELTMVEAALASGVAGHPAVFEVFARSLPAGRRYGVVAGTGRLLAAIEAFRFDRDDVAWLVDEEIMSPSMAPWLLDYHFTGSIYGYPEGETYFPGSPILTVESTFAEGVILETIILSILNFDSGVASTASRMVTAAAGRPVMEMGSRRTHEEAAIAASRAAYIAGFTFTSNLAAGRLYGVPTAGTAAHAFTLAHGDELSAFSAQVAALGAKTSLLVDTYNIPVGIERAVQAARAAGATGPGAIRIDSGDLASEAFRARTQLDSLGASDTRIVVSGDLDEHRIERIVGVGAPVDSFGVGTRLVAGECCPPPGFVYKLVAIADTNDPEAPMRPVAKRCGSKSTVGGRKWAYRPSPWYPPTEVLSAVPLWMEPLQVQLMPGGDPVEATLQARSRHLAARRGLPDGALGLAPGSPACVTEWINQEVYDEGVVEHA
jgi:nicotinate phosphoribosyltransferase